VESISSIKVVSATGVISLIDGLEERVENIAQNHSLIEYAAAGFPLDKFKMYQIVWLGSLLA